VKKTVIILTMVLCMIQMSSFAAPSVGFISDSRALDIQGTSSPGEIVTIIVTNPGINADSLNDTNVSDSLVLLYEFETDDDGAYAGKFTLPATAPAGEYTVYDNRGDFTTFYYADEAEISECITEVTNASESTIESVLEKYTYTKKILGLNLSGDYADYKSCANKLMVGLIKENQPESISDIQDSFEKSLEAAKLSVGEKVTVSDVLQDNMLGIEIEEDLNLSDVADVFMKIRKENVERIEDISKTVREACAIVAVNTSTKGELTQVFEKYNDVLELPLTGKYEKLDKVDVNKHLYHRDFDSVKKIQTAFDKALDEVWDKKSNSSSSKGSTGTGGSTISKIEITTQPENNTDIKQPESDIFDESMIYFTDLDSCVWAQDSINELASKGIVNGVADKIFDPDRDVTREEYLKMLLSAFGIEPSAEKCDFEDVDNAAWYAPYISAATEIGIVKGIDDKNFGVGDAISRQQMAVMTVRMLEYSQKTLNATVLPFTDSELIADYAVNAVAKMVNHGIIKGMDDGSFAPLDNLTRAQAAIVISLSMKAGV